MSNSQLDHLSDEELLKYILKQLDSIKDENPVFYENQINRLVDIHLNK